MRDQALEGTSWQIVSGVRPPTDVMLTAHFLDGAVSGFGGCNSYRANIEVDGDRLSLSGPLMSTRKMCPPPYAAAEFEVFRRLESIASFRREGDRLDLFDADGDLALGLMLVRIEHLTGSWAISSIHVPERQAIIGVAGDLIITFDDRTVSGHGGCNSFHGGFSADHHTIAIGPLATTLMACAPEVMQQEQALHNALQAATSWRVTGHGVDLVRDDGGIELSLRRVMEPRPTRLGGLDAR